MFNFIIIYILFYIL